MANSSPRYAAPSPLSIPAPRSPPKYPDLCGRHRKQAELQVLNREIGFLEVIKMGYSVTFDGKSFSLYLYIKVYKYLYHLRRRTYSFLILFIRPLNVAKRLMNS
ncbi:uncharacterized protein [Aristolochia californica]|uniref:uncharacterized protein isoform X2 n=1 Tax=Aristolochia californica TaxID=171875 RepID=UPI0035E0EED5